MHRDGFDQALLEGVALHVVAVAGEAGVEVDAKAGHPQERDLVAHLDIAARLGERAVRCGAAQGAGEDGPTKTHEMPLPEGTYPKRVGTIEGPRPLRHPSPEPE
jgi:hypothetical protein